MFISDTQWLLLQPLLTPSTSRGRPFLDNRLVLEAIFLKITTRQPWYDLPSQSPSWQTCYQRFHRWQHTGIWESIIKILITDLHHRGGFNLLDLWDGGQLSLKQDHSGQFHLVSPPEFKDTWQLSTALLLLLVLSNGFLSTPKKPCLY
jgi:transposase